METYYLCIILPIGNHSFLFSTTPLFATPFSKLEIGEKREGELEYSKN